MNQEKTAGVATEGIEETVEINAVVTAQHLCNSSIKMEMAKLVIPSEKEFVNTSVMAAALLEGIALGIAVLAAVVQGTKAVVVQGTKAAVADLLVNKDSNE